MCLLHTFAQVFQSAELDHFWPLVRSFSKDIGRDGRLSAASRISAELLNFQTGTRAPYVPALSLHVRDVATYAYTHSCGHLMQNNYCFRWEGDKPGNNLLAVWYEYKFGTSTTL